MATVISIVCITLLVVATIFYKRLLFRERELAVPAWEKRAQMLEAQAHLLQENSLKKGSPVDWDNAATALKEAETIRKKHGNK